MGPSKEVVLPISDWGGGLVGVLMMQGKTAAKHLLPEENGVLCLGNGGRAFHDGGGGMALSPPTSI